MTELTVNCILTHQTHAHIYGDLFETSKLLVMNKSFDVAKNNLLTLQTEYRVINTVPFLINTFANIL